MAPRTCHNCVYSVCDPELWLRCRWAGEPLLPRCANHPCWPGRMHDVTGVPCRNYRPKPVLPQGDDVRLIPLGDGFYAYVDAADYEWLTQWHWYLNGVGYAVRYQRNKRIYMHREIMQPPGEMVVDHIDGNKSNNCRFNLRVCTPLDNQHNRRKCRNTTSCYKGVSYNKRSRKWFSGFGFKGNVVRLGYFSDEIEAARVYDHAAVQYFGQFARVNFPEEWPPERRAQVHADWLKAAKREGEKVRRSEGRRAKGESQKGKAKSTTARKARDTSRRPRAGQKGRGSEGKKVGGQARYEPRETGHGPKEVSRRDAGTQSRQTEEIGEKAGGRRPEAVGAQLPTVNCQLTTDNQTVPGGYVCTDCRKALSSRPLLAPLERTICSCEHTTNTSPPTDSLVHPIRECYAGSAVGES